MGAFEIYRARRGEYRSATGRRPGRSLPRAPRTQPRPRQEGPGGGVAKLPTASTHADRPASKPSTQSLGLVLGDSEALARLA